MGELINLVGATVENVGFSMCGSLQYVVVKTTDGKLLELTASLNLLQIMEISVNGD